MDRTSRSTRCLNKRQKLAVTHACDPPDVLLLAPESQQGELSSYIRSRRQQNSDLRVDLECFDDGERWETAEVLRWAASKYYIKVRPYISYVCLVVLSLRGAIGRFRPATM